MDLTIPYTFYPTALPHWIASTLFLVAMLGASAVAIVRGRTRGWLAGVASGLLSGVGLLLVTMLASMVITFFVHDV